MDNFDDTPIRNPGDDRFGFDPFARAISDCIRNIPNPVGSVVAIYGPWGSGKSSAINLVQYHLSNDAKNINVISFPAWMYHNEDALVVGFLKELYAGLSPVLSKQTQAADAFKKLGASLAGAGNLVGATVGLFTGSIGEKLTVNALDTLGNFIESDEPSEKLQDQLAKALQQEDKRFLVVIDDLDRLSPEEALVIFRLIKSVGRLPNVMYLLAYDRGATEEAVKKKFPSEGARYLEKIVQAGFGLPMPNQHSLISMAGSCLDGIASELPGIDDVELQNLFHSIVVPELKTPRDVIRLFNTLPIVVEPVKSDVFFPDCMSLETLRIFRPNVYEAIRVNKLAILNATQPSPYGEQDERAEKFSYRLLGSEPEGEHERLKEVLMLLFPQLKSIFSNNFFHEPQQWTRQRRVCSKEHFDTYFLFALSPQAIPKKELEYLLHNEKNVEKIQKKFIDAMENTQSEDRSKVSYLLDELAAHGKNVTAQQAELILLALFPIANKIMKRDEIPGFALEDNRWRVEELLRSFLCDRTTIDQAERSEILLRCIKDSPLQLRWLSDFAHSTWIEHHPDESNSRPIPENETLLTREDAETLCEMARCQIEALATDGRLIDEDDLLHVLHAWNFLKADESDEIRRFTADAIEDDQKIVKLARAFLGEAYVRNARNAGIIDRAQTGGIEKILDADKFRKRLKSLVTDSPLSEEEKNIIKRFLNAWEARDREGD